MPTPCDTPISAYQTALGGYAYLCAPYHHHDPKVRQGRAMRAAKLAQEYMHSTGNFIFCPLGHGAAVNHESFYNPAFSAEDKTLSEDFVKAHGLEMLKNAREVLVARIRGWHKSEGIRNEVDLAFSLGKRVSFLWRGDFFESATVEAVTAIDFLREVQEKTLEENRQYTHTKKIEQEEQEEQEELQKRMSEE